MARTQDAHDTQVRGCPAVCICSACRLASMSAVCRSCRLCCCRRFGHVLAAGAVGRGRGSRALLQLALHSPPAPRPGRRYAPAGASSSTGPSAAAAAAGAAGGSVRAVCHDASYWCCLQLEGHEQQLVQLLESIRCTRMQAGQPHGHVHTPAGVMQLACLLDMLTAMRLPACLPSPAAVHGCQQRPCAAAAAPGTARGTGWCS